MSIPGGTKYFCQSHYIGSTREPLLPDGYHRGEREEEKKMWVIFTFFIGRQSLFICLDYFPRSTLKLFIHLFTHIFFQSFNYNPIQFFSGTNSPHFELAWKSHKCTNRTTELKNLDISSCEQYFRSSCLFATVLIILWYINSFVTFSCIFLSFISLFSQNLINLLVVHPYMTLVYIKKRVTHLIQTLMKTADMPFFNI